MNSGNLCTKSLPLKDTGYDHVTNRLKDMKPNEAYIDFFNQTVVEELKLAVSHGMKEAASIKSRQDNTASSERPKLKDVESVLSEIFTAEIRSKLEIIFTTILLPNLFQEFGPSIHEDRQNPDKIFLCYLAFIFSQEVVKILVHACQKQEQNLTEKLLRECMIENYISGYMDKIPGFVTPSMPLPSLTTEFSDEYCLSPEITSVLSDRLSYQNQLDDYYKQTREYLEKHIVFLKTHCADVHLHKGLMEMHKRLNMMLNQIEQLVTCEPNVENLSKIKALKNKLTSGRIAFTKFWDETMILRENQQDLPESPICKPQC